MNIEGKLIVEDIKECLKAKVIQAQRQGAGYASSQTIEALRTKAQKQIQRLGKSATYAAHKALILEENTRHLRAADSLENCLSRMLLKGPKETYRYVLEWFELKDALVPFVEQFVSLSEGHRPKDPADFASRLDDLRKRYTNHHLYNGFGYLYERYASQVEGLEPVPMSQDDLARIGLQRDLCLFWRDKIYKELCGHGR